MTRRDLITCLHEPFGDAFYFGPEKISPACQRWPADKIEKSGRAHYTYDYVLQSILDAIKVREGNPSALSIHNHSPLPTQHQEPNKRVLIKDMTYHIVPPSHSPTATAPSLQHHFNPNDPPNPTLLPTPHLQTFKFIFLIRNPSASIPSLYRCLLPPLSQLTDEHTLDPRELGYRETRTLFDHLHPPASRTLDAAAADAQSILIDADDLLAHPHSILRSLCTRLDFPYSASMLSWPTLEDQAHARGLCGKYAGFHEDALGSTALWGKRADQGRGAKTGEEEDAEWRERYGIEAAGKIREAVDLCREDYEYLRQFRIRPEE